MHVCVCVWRSVQAAAGNLLNHQGLKYVSLYSAIQYSNPDRIEKQGLIVLVRSRWPHEDQLWVDFWTQVLYNVALQPLSLNKDLFPLRNCLDPVTLHISVPHDTERDGKQLVQMSCEE